MQKEIEVTVQTITDQYGVIEPGRRVFPAPFANHLISIGNARETKQEKSKVENKGNDEGSKSSAASQPAQASTEKTAKSSSKKK